METINSRSEEFMNVTYRGCEVSATRDQAMGGWSEIYWYAFSASGYELTSGFGNYGNVREAFADMKKTVNRFLDDCHGSTEEFEKLKGEE